MSLRFDIPVVSSREVVGDLKTAKLWVASSFEIVSTPFAMSLSIEIMFTTRSMIDHCTMMLASWRKHGFRSRMEHCDWPGWAADRLGATCACDSSSTLIVLQ